MLGMQALKRIFRRSAQSLGIQTSSVFAAKCVRYVPNLGLTTFGFESRHENESIPPMLISDSNRSVQGSQDDTFDDGGGKR